MRKILKKFHIIRNNNKEKRIIRKLFQIDAEELK